MPPKSNQSPPQIDREEWDFDTNHEGKESGYAGCPDRELKSCYHYEFSRTCFLKAQEGKLGEKVCALAHDPYLKELLDLFRNDFPQKPWLAIKQSKRTARLKRFTFDPSNRYLPFQHVRVEALLQNGKYQNSRYLAGVHPDLHALLTCPIRVNLTASNAEITKGFENWLTKLRSEYPSIPTPPPRKNAKSALRSALKELGALRLREQMEASQAEEHTKKYICFNGLSAPLYKGASSWSHAVKNAKRIARLWTAPDLLKQLLDEQGIPEWKQGGRASNLFIKDIEPAWLVLLGSKQPYEIREMIPLETPFPFRPPQLEEPKEGITLQDSCDLLKKQVESLAKSFPEAAVLKYGFGAKRRKVTSA